MLQGQKVYDVWSGGITHQDLQIIDDLHFSAESDLTSSNPYISFAPDARLEFLSLVDTALIPLSLAAGPSLDVWTENEGAEAWFADVFLRDGDQDEEKTGLPWWETHSTQSSTGVLLQATQSGFSHVEATPRITEVLLYGCVTEPHTAGRPLTPPVSSPGLKATPEGIRGHRRELRIRALPLSSELLSKTSPFPPISDNSVIDTRSKAEPSSSAKKRRIATLFEDDAERRKRSKRKGSPRDSRPTGQVEIKREDLGESHSATHHRAKLPRPRSSGSSSISSNRSGCDVEPPRPQSRRGVVAKGKRSSLSQVANSNTNEEGAAEPTIESRNKAALSRIVMAGLRIYGLQQKRSGRGKSISSGSLPELTLPTLPNQPTNPDRPGEADEYKLVYHQTFKGASFALRQHITITVLKQDDMRDVVDRLLAIFCADPLADSHSPAVIFNQDQSTNDSKSPFASSARAAGEVVSTPTVRRRHRDEEQRRPDESPLQHFKSRDVG